MKDKDIDYNLFSSEINDMISDFMKQTNSWWFNCGKGSRVYVSKKLALLFSGEDFLKDPDALFWKQINDVRRRYRCNTDRRIMFLRAVVFFYKYVIKVRPDLELFVNSRTLYPSLLDNRSFVIEWLEGGFSFMTFKPGLIYDSRDRFIFILRGADQESSRFRKNDYVKVDLTSISSPLYRKWVFDYVCSSIDRIKNYNQTIFSFPMNCLSELKGTPGYKNPKENKFTTNESIYLADRIRKQYAKNDRSFIRFLAGVKGFFSWCVDSNYLSIDRTFFDFLTTHKKTLTQPIISRPDSDNRDVFLKESKRLSQEDPEHYLVFDTIVHLLLSTPLRVSSICGLKRDCVRPTALKPGTFMLSYVSKTSAGDVDTIPITPREKALIDKMLAFNEHLVAKAPMELKDNLFLYIPNRKDYVRVPDRFAYSWFVKSLCEAIGIPKVQATSLRKEYQSQVKNFIVKKDKNEADYLALSGHKHVETTDRHYVTTLEEYFEQMYQVELGEHHEEVAAKVVEKVPANLERVGDMNNKCGACNSSMCIARLALPCFLCKDFITSKEFLPVFQKMVDEVCEKIIMAENPHDKEDLNAIKSVLVSYIAALSRL